MSRVTDIRDVFDSDRYFIRIAAVLHVLEDGPKTVAEVAEDLDCGHTTARNGLVVGFDEGLLDRRHRPTRGQGDHPYEYFDASGTAPTAGVESGGAVT